MPEILYRDACRMVLSALDRDVAFEDYVVMVRAYGVDHQRDLLGNQRWNGEYRRNLGVTPFCDLDKNGFYYAVLFAEAYGITLPQLSDFFADLPPSSGQEAMCLVEDAICILDAIANCGEWRSVGAVVKGMKP